MHKKLTKNKCLVCGSNRIFRYLNLGETALANSFLKKTQLKVQELRAPLEVFYCKDCHLAQLGTVVNRKSIFQKYAYASSDSPQLQKYFKDYADNVYSRFPAKAKKLTLEIASNDGILLQHFKNLGAKVLGIDPAKNIAKIANKRGIETIPKFFNLETAKMILRKYGKVGLITANNVLAHTDDPHEIIGGVKKLLDEKGVFIFEVQYLKDLLKNNEFDNTYHEHVFYFSLAPLITLLSMHDLEIFNVEQTTGQGGSIRVYATHTPSSFPLSPEIKNILAEEKKQGLYSFKTYQEFSTKPKKIKKDLVNLLKKLKKSGKTVVGYGASAKGNTLLQFSNIDAKFIDYIVDGSALKQNKYTPGTHIPVYSTTRLKTDTPDYVLILAWNYADSIIEKESWLKDLGVKFIIPVPKVKII